MEIFKFEKDDITRFIEYELRTLDTFKEPLMYIVNQLEKYKNCLTIESLDDIHLNKIKERKGKNYHWSAFKYKNVTLVVRRYRQHLTIFTIVKKETLKKSKVEFGAFILNTDFDKFNEDIIDSISDVYYNQPFTDLNIIAKDLFELLIERGVHFVWNSAALKRPKHVGIKFVFCDKLISSIDDFAFCMEELDSEYLTFFSENIMLKKLKELTVGTKINDRYKIGKIITTVKNDYYHGAGIELIDTMSENKTSWNDVYSLTRWFFKDIFKDDLYSYNGQLYVKSKGGKFKAGMPVAYKNLDEVTLYEDSFPKENFIPLKKY